MKQWLLWQLQPVEHQVSQVGADGYDGLVPISKGFPSRNQGAQHSRFDTSGEPSRQLALCHNQRQSMFLGTSWSHTVTVTSDSTSWSDEKTAAAD
jgi:hypothetical protein